MSRLLCDKAEACAADRLCRTASLWQFLWRRACESNLDFILMEEHQNKWHICLPTSLSMLGFRKNYIIHEWAVILHNSAVSVAEFRCFGQQHFCCIQIHAAKDFQIFLNVFQNRQNIAHNFFIGFCMHIIYFEICHL